MTDGADHGAATPGVMIGGADRHVKRRGIARFIPLFIGVVLVYMIGKYFIPDPRAVLLSLGPFHLSWVEVLYLGASTVAMFELLRVSGPGINNTTEAIMMGLVAVVQAMLIVAALNNPGFAMFKTTEFVMLTFLSALQAGCAFLINAATLQRTISQGGL